MSESLAAKTLRRTATAFRAIAVLKNWPIYFADYAGRLKSERVTYVLRNGLRYELRPGSADRGIFTEVWLRDDYRRALCSAGTGNVVIDLGAQAGFAATFFAFNTGGSVHAYEPSPENFELLERNIMLNGLADRVIPHRLGVSGERGERAMYLSRTNTGGHSMLRTEGAPIKVDCISLDDIFEQNKLARCVLLKVDVEGSEYAIFYGCTRETLGRIDTIVLEYHDFPDVAGHTHGELMQFLQRAGFSVTKRASYLYCTR